MSAPEYKISQLVPHEKPMQLIDEMVDYDEEWFKSYLEITPETEFLNENGAVPSWVGIEYMAQTIAAFAGRISREQGEPVKIGFLVGSRKYSAIITEFPIGMKLLVTAERVMQGENGLSVFQCTIEDAGNGEQIASASLNVFQPDDANEFLQNS
ncbi:MAG: 3-hydroxylacyl-ACP dehydratase [Gammaproteobacteria bacterium]|nr:MAG: 3-hydroxylacyl-ACP dehydratase [Gammaproteobacteria bacterium]